VLAHQALPDEAAELALEEIEDHASEVCDVDFVG
jgi:hypothetical protein